MKKNYYYYYYTLQNGGWSQYFYSIPKPEDSILIAIVKYFTKSALDL